MHENIKVGDKVFINTPYHDNIEITVSAKWYEAIPASEKGWIYRFDEILPIENRVFHEMYISDKPR